MRLLGGFQNLNGPAALALFGVPALASVWAIAAGPGQKGESPDPARASIEACPAQIARPVNAAQAGSLDYRNGEVRWTPGPRAMRTEWIWLKVREARLIAERSGRGVFAPPPEFAALEDNNTADQAMASERAVLAARRATHAGFERELGQRLKQVKREHAAILKMAQGRKRERDLLAQELNGIAYLHKRGLATTGRLVSLQRDMERLRADQAQLELDAERVLSRTGEIELDLLRRNADRQIEIADGLRIIEARFAELDDMRGGGAPVAGVRSETQRSGAPSEAGLVLAAADPCAQSE